MNEPVAAALWPVEPKPVVVIPPLTVEDSPKAPVTAPSTEEINALDRAFVGDREQTDAVAGLMGLWLSTPFLADLLADHFRKPPEEEEPALPSEPEE